MATSRYGVRPAACPEWCASKHGQHGGEDDHVHVSGARVVRRTVLRLCESVDPDTGARDGPYVLLGSDEFTLAEAHALVDALTRLIDDGMGVSLRAEA